MGEVNHKVNQQKAGAVHSEVPAVRDTSDFDVSQMSVESRAAWKAVCLTDNPTKEDFRHVFNSIMRSKVVDAILK
ncbi:hypothetical protein [Desulfovibrio gilichinskyi]|uniref:Uncharacterized protein n=1 Tax=Desulfovibrio gilichinskyi TaxID=1519643 RepID=A0A1X7C3S8_9BACT|nr:hypothetical protein [Desulfovibrio gilichinskyi]SME89486.1 hypothetical protein SAMN06295933_0310 [Desulfovibrio gilichinskyi]